MAESTVWWVLAGGIVAVELLTGTFYLLMLSFGFVAAAISGPCGRHNGNSTRRRGSLQQRLSHRLATLPKVKPPMSVSANTNQDGNLDVGETIQIDAWRPRWNEHREVQRGKLERGNIGGCRTSGCWPLSYCRSGWQPFDSQTFVSLKQQ